jgi:hypothetical protein
VNVEQVLKRKMRMPTLRELGGRLVWPVKRAMNATGRSAGIVTAARVCRGSARNGKSSVVGDGAQPETREGMAGLLGMADGLI